MRPLGVLSMLVALPTIDAGFTAAPVFLREDDELRALLSALGGLGGLLLLAAGVLLSFKRDVGRRVAYGGAALSMRATIAWRQSLSTACPEKG